MPRLIRNPFMSLWLSTANRMAQTGHGLAVSAARRHNAAVGVAASAAVMRFWTSALRGAPGPKH